MLLLVAGCGHGSLSGARASRWTSPLSRAELPTTDGSIAFGNLEAQIEGEERLAAFGPLSVARRAGIAELVALRGQLSGRIADYERAVALAEQLVLEAPADGRAFLARARACSSLHRFDDALADLAQAERLGLGSESIESLRAAIFQATGRYDEALAIRQDASRAAPTIGSLGAEASLRAEMGDIDAAERLFTEAQRRYRDVSPFPVVWIYFQEAQMWMREGQLERARALFAAAHARLPAYAAAQGHLAEVEAALGRCTRAIALLAPLAESADDPDYAAQLARILGDAGRPAEARRWRDVAATRYETLTARYPEAFADHAAEFWLAAGNDAAKGLRLAERNLALRKTARAYELVLQAALAAGEPGVACAVAERARAGRYAWPNLRVLTEQALARCADSRERDERDRLQASSPSSSSGRRTAAWAARAKLVPSVCARGASVSPM